MPPRFEQRTRYSKRPCAPTADPLERRIHHATDPQPIKKRFHRRSQRTQSLFSEGVFWPSAEAPASDGTSFVSFATFCGIPVASSVAVTRQSFPLVDTATPLLQSPRATTASSLTFRAVKARIRSKQPLKKSGVDVLRSQARFELCHRNPKLPVKDSVLSAL
ncbi:MAG: hypothetical protein ACI9OU_002734 [Candidatus Promineifilaceae bacterium]|jgi:hypothetical protein